MQAQLRFDRMAAQQIDDPKQNDDSQNCFTMFYQSKHITRCLCSFDSCSGVLPHLLPPLAVGITAKLRIMCKACTSVQVSLVSFASAYGKRNRCHFTTEILPPLWEAILTTSSPEFPNMAPLLSHSQLSWQCEKELNSSNPPENF